MKNPKIHHAADVWPTLPDDELQALADSISEVGLLEPLVLTPDGELLDGRNRRAACLIAGVEPETTVYDGDPVAYVLARNDTRRHMTKGQRAMAAWMTAASESLTIREVAERASVGEGMTSWAKVVHDHLTPDVVAAVIAGARPLKDAYDEARARRDGTPGAIARSLQTRMARRDRIVRNAYQGRVWIPLGYRSWDEWRTEEFFGRNDWPDWLVDRLIPTEAQIVGRR